MKIIVHQQNVTITAVATSYCAVRLVSRSHNKPITPLSLSPSHLAQNPFMCDCHLKWLADYLFDNPIETSGARCSHPRRLANKRISQVKGKKFRCTGEIWVQAGAPILTHVNTHRHRWRISNVKNQHVPFVAN